MVNDAQLAGVTSLDVSSSSENPADIQEQRYISGLFPYLPNLREINFSYVKAPVAAYRMLGRLCPDLTRIIGTGSQKCVLMIGIGLNLEELYLNDSHIVDSWSRDIDATRTEYESTTGRIFLFRQCGSLERLSIKGASWSPMYGHPSEPRDITQEMLMKMVRNHRNLRWLQSDLSEENVEILKRERPEITFVS